MATKDVGFAAGPITYTEIVSFNAGTRAGLTPWDIELIRDIDDLARGIAAGHIDPATCKKKRSSLGQLLRERAAEQKRKGVGK